MSNSKLDLLDEQQTIQLLSFKIGRFDQLASDALSILGIQIVIFPVFVAATAIVVTVHEISSGQLTAATVLAVLSDEYTGEMAAVQMIAWGVNATGVVLALRAYYRSRKIAHRLPNVFRNQVLPPRLSRSVTPKTTATTIVGTAINGQRTLKQFVDTHTTKPTLAQISAQQFDAIGTLERELRTTLMLSVVCTPVSILLLLVSYLPPALLNVLVPFTVLSVVLMYSIIVSSHTYLWSTLERLLEWLASLSIGVIIAGATAVIRAISRLSGRINRSKEDR
ncbi:hypothetical protein [Halocatena halophila]|uniref:hypothetical protein n=1 Tax=Halocatena halophila TaxID=2814576 RepID=UPI002ED1F796